MPALDNIMREVLVVLKDRDKLTQLVLDELADLHEGNISPLQIEKI